MNLLIEKLQITLPVSICEYVVRVSVIVSEMVSLVYIIKSQDNHGSLLVGCLIYYMNFNGNRNQFVP